MTASRMWARVAPLNFSSAASHCLAATARCFAFSSRSQVRTVDAGRVGERGRQLAQAGPRPPRTSPRVDQLRGLPVTGDVGWLALGRHAQLGGRRAAARPGAASIRSRRRSSAPPRPGRPGRAAVVGARSARRSPPPDPRAASQVRLARPCARARARRPGASAFHASSARPACNASTALLNAVDVGGRQIDGPCRRTAPRGVTPARRLTRSSTSARSASDPSSAGIAANSGSRSALSGFSTSRAPSRRSITSLQDPLVVVGELRLLRIVGRVHDRSFRSSWWIRPSVCPHSCRKQTISLCALRSP